MSDIKKGIRFSPSLCVTHSCNLNCKYCCVGDVVEHHVMDETTINNLFKKLADDCSESTIIWHGGEPLIVGLPFYKRAIELQANYPNHKFKNSLQTNGTLLNDEFLDFFEDNHFSLGFSIDGCKLSHNLNRPLKDGLESFELTFKWYKEVERRGMHPGAICVINANTARYIKEIYAFAKENKVAFKFNTQYPAGRASINVDLGLNDRQIANAYVELFDLWYNDAPEDRANIRMFEHFVESITKITNGDKSVQGFDCAWANRCQKSFIGIATNGDVYPCGKFVDERDFLYGNINEERSLQEILDNDIREKFLIRHNDGIIGCNDCQYLSMCSSGCPHTAYLFTKDLFSKNPFCKATTLLFKHIENVLVEHNKYKDIYIEPINDSDEGEYIVYSPLRGECFIVGERAKKELENYIIKGMELHNKTLQAHLEKWKHQLPTTVHHYNFDTYNRCVILLTQQCNLQCGYCYAKSSRNNETATRENIKVLIDRILSNRPKSQKIFSFIGGGEPTLYWKLLVYSVEYIRKNQNHDNVIISITTNGTLLDEERIGWLKKNRVDVGLSFDILPELQNKGRMFKNGKGSFNRLDKTIKIFHKNGLFFRIRATISDEAVGLMPQMIEFVRDNYPFITHVQLEPVQDRKQNNHIYYEKFIENFIRAHQIGRQSGIVVYNMITLSVEAVKTQFCRGEFCMTPNGSIVACQRFSSEMDKLFPKFSYGKIENGIVSIDDNSLAAVGGLFSQKLPQCETCFAKYNCAGICAAIRSDLPLDQLLEHCKFTKELIKQTLLSYQYKCY